MKGRTCSRCKQEKTAAHFYFNGLRPDGSPRFRSRCIECLSEIGSTPHERPRKCSMCGKKKKPEEFCGNRSSCRSCSNEKTYAFRRGPGREDHNVRMATYVRSKHASDPDYRLKQRARREVHLAVKYGLLVRPEHCPRCKRKAKVHGHHYKGYDKPNWLKVKWLCARCHFKEDSTAHSGDR